MMVMEANAVTNPWAVVVHAGDASESSKEYIQIKSQFSAFKWKESYVKQDKEIRKRTFCRCGSDACGEVCPFGLKMEKNN